MQTITLLLPILIIIVVGFSLCRFKILNKDIVSGLNGFIFYVAGPSLIFSAISQEHFADMMVWGFWLALLLLIVVTICISFLVLRLICKEDLLSSGIMSFYPSIKNSVIVLLPILLALAGNRAVIPVAISLFVYGCLVFPFWLFLLEINHQKSIDKPDTSEVSRLMLIKTTTVNVFKNPIILSAILGASYSYFNFAFVDSIMMSIKMMGEAFSPCALIAVGAELSNYHFKKITRLEMVITIITLVICPLIALLISALLGLSPFWKEALVVMAAMPTAKVVYVLTSPYEPYKELSSCIILSTTFFSVFSVMFWLGVIRHF